MVGRAPRTQPIILGLPRFGAGREAFHGLIRNTDAFYKMLALLGLSHKNPSMTPEEARKFMSRAPRIRTEDWA
jgi:hypothetical protein